MNNIKEKLTDNEKRMLRLYCIMLSRYWAEITINAEMDPNYIPVLFINLDDMLNMLEQTYDYEKEYSKEIIDSLVNKGFLCEKEIEGNIDIALTIKGANIVTEDDIFGVSKTFSGVDVDNLSLADFRSMESIEDLDNLYDADVSELPEIDYENVLSTYLPKKWDKIKSEIDPSLCLNLKEVIKDKLQPQDIKQFLDNFVFSQEEAKKQAAMILWERNRDIKENALFIGPSGSGKTEIWRTLQKLNNNIYIYDVSSITADGFTGNKKSYSVLEEMLASGMSVEDVEHSIIVFDEFDKMCSPKITSGGEQLHRTLQGEFLSMIEGTNVTVNFDKYSKVIINTSNISFVFLGAFEMLYKAKTDKPHTIGFGSENDVSERKEISIDDIIKFGIIPEIAGRITSITELNELKEEDFYKILCDKRISPEKKMSDKYNISIYMSDDLKKEIAKKAFKNKLGVRFLLSQTQTLVNKQIYEKNAEAKEIKLEL